MYNFYVTDVRYLMNKILKENVFDDFEVRSIELETFVKYQIRGNLNKTYLDDTQEKRYFCKWSELKPYVFQLIKGKKKPTVFKIVFSVSDNKAINIHNNAKALFLNISFENDIVKCTTGTSQINFSLNKDVDNSWEEYIRTFFNNFSIIITEDIFDEEYAKDSDKDDIE